MDDWVTECAYTYSGMLALQKKDILMQAATWVNLRTLC